jgi:hypothetical protein
MNEATVSAVCAIVSTQFGGDRGARATVGLVPFSSVLIRDAILGHCTKGQKSILKRENPSAGGAISSAICNGKP